AQNTEIQQVIGAAFPSTFTGRCTAPKSDVGFSCLKNQDCDESQDGGDGRCSLPKFELTNPITDTNQCSGLMKLVVPLNYKATGPVKTTRKLKFKVNPSPDPITGKARKSDTDTLKLLCRPAP